MTNLHLDGSSLTIDALKLAVEDTRTCISICPDGVERMLRARKIIDNVIREGRPVYGVTTGLGARSNVALNSETLGDFSLQTLRGRAHAQGPECPPEDIRAAMIVRLNTLLLGFSGAGIEVADVLQACLNAGLTPVVGQIGSIGAADLVLNATIGLALTGESRLCDRAGMIASASLRR